MMHRTHCMAPIHNSGPQAPGAPSRRRGSRPPARPALVPSRAPPPVLAFSRTLASSAVLRGSTTVQALGARRARERARARPAVARAEPRPNWRMLAATVAAAKRGQLTAPGASSRRPAPAHGVRCQLTAPVASSPRRCRLGVGSAPGSPPPPPAPAAQRRPMTMYCSCSATGATSAFSPAARRSAMIASGASRCSRGGPIFASSLKSTTAISPPGRSAAAS